MKTTVAAIDFGTSKIVTLVAENSGSQRCDITAAGVTKYDGYLEEGWNNPGMLDEAIRRSIADAEEQSGSKIKEINGCNRCFHRFLMPPVSRILSKDHGQSLQNNIHLKELYLARVVFARVFNSFITFFCHFCNISIRRYAHFNSEFWIVYGV